METDNLVYDPITKTMITPLSFITTDVTFDNSYYHKDINWWLSYFQDSIVLGYILNPDHDYYSIKLAEPIGEYTYATPCIFFKRDPKVSHKNSHKFNFDSERNVDDEYYEQYPYVVMLRGCDDGHLGLAVSDISEAKSILESVNDFKITNIQDLNELSKLHYHN